MRKFKPGDKVVKNERTWVETEFDLWGRGVGVGVVVDPPYTLGDYESDVRWKGGRCFEFNKQLKPYESKFKRFMRKYKVWEWKYGKAQAEMWEWNHENGFW